MHFKECQWNQQHCKLTKFYDSAPISFSASWQKCLKANECLYEFVCRQRMNKNLVLRLALDSSQRLLDWQLFWRLWAANRGVRRRYSVLEITCWSTFTGRKKRRRLRAQSPKTVPVPAQSIHDWLPGSLLWNSPLPPQHSSCILTSLALCMLFPQTMWL